MTIVEYAEQQGYLSPELQTMAAVLDAHVAEQEDAVIYAIAAEASDDSLVSDGDPYYRSVCDMAVYAYNSLIASARPSRSQWS